MTVFPDPISVEPSTIQAAIAALDPKTGVMLTVTSAVSWFISTLSGGGSSLLIIPFIGVILGAKTIAPVTTIGALLGNGDRVVAYRHHVRWDVVAWEMPGAIVGSFLGAFVLTHISVRFVTLTVGICLLSSALSFFWKSWRSIIPTTTPVFTQTWYFLPAGVLYGFLSGVIGSIGPVLAPIYLAYGLEKQELLGTQAATRMAIHLVKVGVYSVFGILNTNYILYGFILGLAALPGNWLGHHVLLNISEQLFRRVAMFFVLFSGLLMVGQNVVM